MKKVWMFWVLMTVTLILLCAQPAEGASWKSKPVKDQYSRDDLAKAYGQVFGEGVINDSYLEAILLSPQVSYELKKTGEGCRLVIDATTKQEIKYIFGQ